MTIHEIEPFNHLKKDDIVYKLYYKNNNFLLCPFDDNFIKSTFKFEIISSINDALICKVYAFFKSEMFPENIKMDYAELELKGGDLYFMNKKLDGLKSVSITIEEESIATVSFYIKCEVLFI